MILAETEKEHAGLFKGTGIHDLYYKHVLPSKLHRTFIGGGGITMMKQITALEALQAHIQGKSVLLLGTEWNEKDEAACAIGGQLITKNDDFQSEVTNYQFFVCMDGEKVRFYLL